MYIQIAAITTALIALASINVSYKLFSQAINVNKKNKLINSLQEDSKKEILMKINKMRQAIEFSEKNDCKLSLLVVSHRDKTSSRIANQDSLRIYRNLLVMDAIERENPNIAIDLKFKSKYTMHNHIKIQHITQHSNVDGMKPLIEGIERLCDRYIAKHKIEIDEKKINLSDMNISSPFGKLKIKGQGSKPNKKLDCTKLNLNNISLNNT